MHSREYKKLQAIGAVEDVLSPGLRQQLLLSYYEGKLLAHFFLLLVQSTQIDSSLLEIQRFTAAVQVTKVGIPNRHERSCGIVPRPLLSIWRGCRVHRLRWRRSQGKSTLRAKVEWFTPK